MLACYQGFDFYPQQPQVWIAMDMVVSILQLSISDGGEDFFLGKRRASLIPAFGHGNHFAICLSL
jgi:hypothetical protein